MTHLHRLDHGIMIDSAVSARLGNYREAVAFRGVARLAPQLLCRVTTVQRAVQPYLALNNVATMAGNMRQAQEALQRGDAERAAELLSGTAGLFRGSLGAIRETGRLARAVTQGPTAVRNFLAACFAAGTPILWEGGSKNIEDFRVGDRVWARDENDENGQVELKEVEECFETEAEIWHLHVGGQVIRTTQEHPFWVVGRGWTNAKDLRSGDLLGESEGRIVPVDEIVNTGLQERVYNFRIADYHTYYVGGPNWGFAVWVHNACVGAYSELINSNQKPAGAQVHHLNQNAAYGATHTAGGIPYRQGVTIYLQGATNLPGTPHYIVHQRLNQFWAPHRLNDTFPTNRQYARALGAALRAAKIPEMEIRSALAAARAQRLAFGLLDNMPIPRVPLR